MAYYIKPDSQPTSIEAGTDNPLAPIRVYSAPWRVEDENCCPEDDEQNRIEVRTELLPSGWLWIRTIDPPQGFTQIAVTFDYHTLFGDPSLYASGFAVRFYVESAK